MAASASRRSCSADDVGAADRDADARRRVELATRQRDRLVQHRDDALGELDRLGDVGDVFAHDHELVAAEARHRVGRADRTGEPTRDLDEQLVADDVTETVVDELEAVEVEEQDRDVALGAFGARQRVREAVDEQQAVGEVGEVVVQRLVRERLLGALAVGDVAHLHEVVARVAVGVAHERHVDQHRDDAAVAPHHAVLALVERVRRRCSRRSMPPTRALALGRVEELERAPTEQPVAGCARAARRARGSPT